MRCKYDDYGGSHGLQHTRDHWNKDFCHMEIKKKELVVLCMLKVLQKEFKEINDLKEMKKIINNKIYHEDWVFSIAGLSKAVLGFVNVDIFAHIQIAFSMSMQCLRI